MYELKKKIKPKLAYALAHALLRPCSAAFKSGDKDALRSARANLNNGVVATKLAYSQIIQSHFTDSKDPRLLRKGIQSITDYRYTPPACDDNTDFFRYT